MPSPSCWNWIPDIFSQPLTGAALKRGNPTFLGQIPNDHAVTELAQGI